MSIEIALVGLVAVILLMAALWLTSLALKNSSIVDIFWGPGFALAAWVYAVLTPSGYLPRRLLVLTLITLWGLRLGLHIAIRSVGKGEDRRYVGWRASVGTAWWWQSLFRVFLLQGVLLWLIAMPLMAALAATVPAALTPFDGVGALVWGIGFCFEAVGDWQLARFRADPRNRGQVLRAGLWRYSRHPNYFGDATLWWGLFIIALGVPGGFFTIFSPLVMTGFLMRVSGVPLLEKSLTKTKPEYRDYIACTSEFIPWFPRQRDEE
jgi:steroid 5-alpha reductase family enzyme